jgi:hypothetical protein
MAVDRGRDFDWKICQVTDRPLCVWRGSYQVTIPASHKPPGLGKVLEIFGSCRIGVCGHIKVQDDPRDVFPVGTIGFGVQHTKTGLDAVAIRIGGSPKLPSMGTCFGHAGPRHTPSIQDL